MVAALLTRALQILCFNLVLREGLPEDPLRVVGDVIYGPRVEVLKEIMRLFVVQAGVDILALGSSGRVEGAWAKRRDQSICSGRDVNDVFSLYSTEPARLTAARTGDHVGQLKGRHFIS
jgi:hypothetical protein